MKLKLKREDTIQYTIWRGAERVGMLMDREHASEEHRWLFVVPGKDLSVTGHCALEVTRAGLLLGATDLKKLGALRPTPLDAIKDQLLDLNSTHETVGW